MAAAPHTTTQAAKPKPKDDDKDKRDESGLGPLGERLFRSRTIHLSGAVDDKLAARVVAELLALEADDAESPITMFLNSPGGSVTSGFAIYDVMRFIGPDVHVICTGLTASIATVILLAAPADKRLALPNARLLIHQPHIPMTVYGPASDLEITAREILKTRERINTLIANETKRTLAQVEKETQRDYWLTAEAAVEYGLLARVVTRRADLA